MKLFVVEEDESYPHRWTDANASDGENNKIASHMRFESKPPVMSLGRKYLVDSSDPMHRHMSDIEYDDGIDPGQGANLDEKYSFPYTGELFRLHQ